MKSKMHVALTPSRIVTVTSPSFLNTKNVDAVPKDPMAFRNEYSGCQTSESIALGNTARSCSKHPLFLVVVSNASLESGQVIVCSMAIWIEPVGSETDFMSSSTPETSTLTVVSPDWGAGGLYSSCDVNIAVRMPPGSVGPEHTECTPGVQVARTKTATTAHLIGSRR